MAWRTSDGDDRSVVHVEPARVDELPKPVPAPQGGPQGGDDGATGAERRRDGTFARGARAMQSRGGLASKHARELLDRAVDALKSTAPTLGLNLGRLLPETEEAAKGTKTGLYFRTEPHLAPFVADTETWLMAQVIELRDVVGGGRLSPGIVSILESAAHERMFSRFLFDVATRAAFTWTKDYTTPRLEIVREAERLAGASRQNILAAFELAAREAAARKSAVPTDPKTWAEHAAEAGKPRKPPTEVEDDDEGSPT